MKPIYEFENRIITGDCIEVMHEMLSASVDCMITDPPYLVNWIDRDGRGYQNDNPNGDGRATGHTASISPSFTLLPQLFPGFEHGLLECPADFPGEVPPTSIIAADGVRTPATAVSAPGLCGWTPCHRQHTGSRLCTRARVKLDPRVQI
jgi:hypothetical protein